MAKNFLTTAAFAKLCRTTKATLLHYDHIGLLVPRKIMENGYRCYGFDQFFTFYLIDLLKKTGSSLAEISSFLNDKSKTNFIPLLEKKLSFIREERLRLAKRETELKSMILAGREALDLRYDQVTTEWQEEEKLEIVPTKISEGQSEAEASSANFSKLLEIVCPNEELPPRPYGSILDMDLFPKGRMVESHYFCGASRSTPKERLLVKNKGHYATIAHLGNSESQQQAILQLYDEIKKQKWQITGNCFCYEMLSAELFDNTAEIMAGKYCIPVRTN